MREDQAAGLRRLFAPGTLRVLRVVDSAWPRRGWFSLNLAAALAQSGERAIVADAECESLSLLWGARTRSELAQVLEGTQRIAEVAASGPASAAIVPMRRAAAALAREGRRGQRSLARELAAIAPDGGWLVVPMRPESLASPLWRFERGAVLIHAGAGGGGITAAYASIKAALAAGGSPQLVLEGERGGATRRFAHLARVTRRFLRCELATPSLIPAGEFDSGHAGLTLFDEKPQASAALDALAAALRHHDLPGFELPVRAARTHSDQALFA